MRSAMRVHSDFKDPMARLLVSDLADMHTPVRLYSVKDMAKIIQHNAGQYNSMS